MTNGRRRSQDFAQDERLLAVVAEGLKLPFLQIAHQAELARVKPADGHLNTIENTAERALRLIDDYLFSRQVEQLTDIQPLSMAAVLYDTAHKLSLMAKDYSCDVELHVSGKYGPVLAHKQALTSALLHLGYAFIEVQRTTDTKRSAIKLAVHRGRSGIVAGLFAKEPNIGANMLKQAKNLYGQASQPMNQFTHSAAANVFVAEALLAPISGGLRTARHQKLAGLAATFTTSHQLSLV